MFEAIAQMGLIIIFGVIWRYLKPGGLDAKTLRKALTDTVYYLLLPALVLSILWKVELNIDSIRIVILAASGVFAGYFLGRLSCHWCKLPPAATGAALLAAAFPNATYLGLPVLEATFGPWARSVAIQYDLFACTPLLFTLGIFIANKFGCGESTDKYLLAVFRIPAVVAAIIAVVLNLAGITQPEFVSNLLTTLERGVVPLMLFSLGLSLQWGHDQWQRLPSVIPIALIQLVLMPATIFALGYQLGMDDKLFAAIVIEAAMPSMVLGIVICERFNLDSSLYAAAVTTSTALSLATLPLWFAFLQ